jgi:enterochelin esterase family protein
VVRNIAKTPAKRRLAIHRLAQKRSLDKEAVDGFLTEHNIPIVEGPSCTFVYRGDADSVRLRNWIYGLPSSPPFRRLSGTDLWYITLELPEGSRVEYKIEVTENGTTQLIEDPLNPLQAHDPFGANSVCHAAGYEIPEWTQPDPQARAGQLRELLLPSKALGGPRKVSLYLPARFRPTRRYPLLVVHDGSDYLRYSAVRVVLDNLIHRLEIPGMIVALTDPLTRLKEYGNDEAHARFIVEELVPHLEKKLPLLGDPRGRGLVGASFGALAAFATAWRYPGFFGRLLLQSGSFVFTDIGDHQRGPAFDPVVEFVNEFRENPTAVTEKVFVTCGMYESLIYENRSLVPLLTATGMDVRYVEARDGHNWENWRDRLREGLSWLFPGPLWMVYE